MDQRQLDQEDEPFTGIDTGDSLSAMLMALIHPSQRYVTALSH
ncbi:hypothetical protein [Marinomonas primoryensis]|jgi:hypothetical protein